MSAEVLAAARGTLRDLDATLAAHEAAQAVAWLDDAFDRLQVHLQHWRVSTPWFAPRSDDRVVRTYMETISTGEGAGRPMLGIYSPPGATELEDGTLSWAHVGDDDASWPMPARGRDIRSEEQQRDDNADVVQQHRQGEGYVVVQPEGVEPVVYRAADVQVQREPWRESLRETLLAELEQVNPEAAARHRSGPRSMADLGIEPPTPYVLTWARSVARMEVLQRAEMEDAMVRLRAMAGPDLTEEHAHRLLVAFSALPEPTRATAFRALLDQVAAGQRIDWTTVTPGTVHPPARWLLVTPSVALTNLWDPTTTEERHP